MTPPQIDQVHDVLGLVGERVDGTSIHGQRALGHQPVTDELVVGEDVTQLEVGLGRPVSHLGKQLAQIGGRLVAPAVLAENVEPEEPVEWALRASVCTLDGPTSPGAPGGTELEPGKVEAALGAHGECAAERIQAEERIGAGNDVHPGDGELRDEVPVDRVPKAIVEAHAVQIHGQPDGTTRQGSA